MRNDPHESSEIDQSPMAYGTTDIGLSSVPVTIHAGREMRGFLIAVNDRGLFAALPSSLPANRLVEVEFEMPDGDRRMRVVGEVNWSSFYVSADGVGFSGVGIEFLAIGDAGLDYLHRFLSANQGERIWQRHGLDTSV